MTNLLELTLDSNQLTNLYLPPNLYGLTTLDLENNQISTLTLPAAVTNLSFFFVSGNPLTRLVLSEAEVANVANAVAVLQTQGVAVFTYPMRLQLVRPRALTGAFQFGITGPPGDYSILGSSDLKVWSEVGIASNTIGSVSFIDATSHLFPRRFYRARPLAAQ
jgi:Leucine-rich repeat (LRR) protein